MPAQQRYDALAKIREPSLEMGRLCAQYTLPYLLPPQGHQPGSFLPNPKVPTAAIGVTQLSSKMLLIMLPASGGSGGFRLQGFPLPDSSTTQDVHSRTQSKLLKVERLLQRFLSSGPLRRCLDEALKLLLITGTVCLVLDEDWGGRVFRLDQMCCRRDPASGDPVEVITAEETDIALLPEDVYRASFGSQPSSLGQIRQLSSGYYPSGYYSGSRKKQSEQRAKILTHWVRDQTHWSCHQEINDVKVKGSEGRWPIEHAPIMVPTTNCPDGEDYGHSHIESMLEDVQKLFSLAKLIYEAESANTRMLILRNPNGITRASDLEKENLSIINGVPQDVSAMRLNKGAEINGAMHQLQYYSRRVQQALLQTAGMHRSGERVTAEEVRGMNAEAELALGGIYITCSEQLLKPLLQHSLWVLQQKGYVPPLDQEDIDIKIISGAHTISREHELGQLRGFVQDYAMFSQSAQQLGIRPRDLLHRLAVCWGVDPTGLIMTPEEQAQQAQQAQLQQLMQSAGPDVIQQYARGAFPQLMRQ